MLYTKSKPERPICALDDLVEAATRTLERAINAKGGVQTAAARTLYAEECAARLAGGMMDRLARIAEYVEETKLGYR